MYILPHLSWTCHARRGAKDSAWFSQVYLALVTINEKDPAFCAPSKGSALKKKIFPWWLYIVLYKATIASTFFFLRMCALCVPSKVSSLANVLYRATIAKPKRMLECVCLVCSVKSQCPSTCTYLEPLQRDVFFFENACALCVPSNGSAMILIIIVIGNSD